MKRFFLVSLMCVAAVVNAAAAFTLTASKVTITDMTVDILRRRGCRYIERQVCHFV